jgi:hypothetical protein
MYLQVAVPLLHTTPINPTPIAIAPPNALPVLLLVFQKNVLKVEVLPHFHFDIRCIVDLAANSE